MNIISFDFALFFLAVLILYAAAPRKLKPGLLLAASLIFYGMFRACFVGLLVAQALVAWGGARCLGDPARPKRRAILALAIVAVLAPLLIFKYLDFVLQIVSGLARAVSHGHPLSLIGFALPAGISFYTFKSISYLVDVYRRKIPAQRDPIPVALYVSFFPQVLAGPIERAGNFMAQLEKNYAFDIAQVGEGARRIVWGLFKKMVVADRLSQYVNIVFDRPGDFRDLSLVFGLIFYAFEIYADFSGYSDMAIGLARVLGMETMENFRFPYFSRSIVEFWSRWHISLSTWLRDYLFLPMSYALSRRIKAARVLLIQSEYIIYILGMGLTMLLCGLWHGASWTFVVWGGVHGFYLVVSRATKRLRARALHGLHLRKTNPLLAAGRTLFTFALTTLAWVFFRSPSLQGAWSYLGSISLRLPQRGTGPLLFLSSLLAVFILIEFLMKNAPRLFGERKVPAFAQVVGLALVVCLIIVLALDTTNEFLYFRF
jgi:alginate O-acetyltransferase complex protein AlgI